MTELFARYGRLYAALAPLSIGLSFLPPFTFVMRGDQAVFFGTVWDMASTPAGDPARAAMVLLPVMFGCLLAAALWPTVPALPTISGLAAAAVGVLLWTRPATGDPAPDLSGVGKAHLAVAAGIVATSAIHLGHLVRHRRQVRQRQADTVAADATGGDGRLPSAPTGLMPRPHARAGVHTRGTP